MRDWRAYVRSHLRLTHIGPAREARIVRELAALHEDVYRAALEAGATPEEADAQARAQIADWDRLARDVAPGDGTRDAPALAWGANVRESPARGVRGGGAMFADVVRDTRYAVRQFAASPGFTAVAVLTMALGIGSTTVIFSLVDGLILRPLPYPESHALMRVNEVVPQYGRFSVAPAVFLDWRSQNRSFARMAALTTGTATFRSADGPERIPVASVSWEFFDVLRTPPALGRTFTEDEDAPGGSDVAVVSHATWQRRFGGDPSLIGQAVTLSGVPTTIVGVMPAGFAYPRDAEFWQPLALDAADAPRGAHYLAVVARLRDGVSVTQANAEMQAIAEALAREYPESSEGESAEVVPMLDQMLGGVRQPLYALLAAVGLVLLIACANVANLLLVRASVRHKEMAIRTAIGANPSRVMGQLLVESALLALLGGAAGVALAYAAIEPIQTLSAGSIPRVHDVGIDVRVLLFALAMSLVTGLVFGLAPAWRASRADAAPILKDSGWSPGGGGRDWTRGGLLVVEVALSIVLLVGAGLLLRSFARLTDVDPGFTADNVLAFRVSLPESAYPEDRNRIAFYEALAGRLDALPGVRAAGLVQSLPMRDMYVLSFAVQGRPAPRPEDEPSANHRVINPHYFSALGIPVVRGRAFTERDTESSPMVAIIDEAFAARHFPNQDPIGQRIDIGNGTDGFYDIVGVVGNVRYRGLAANPFPTMYVPYRQDVFSSMWLLVQAEGDARLLAPAVRAAVGALDPSLPAYAMTPLTEVLSESVGQRRFALLLLVVFAIIALVLAVVGIYGVAAAEVSRRTAEIGVRVALGAARQDVVALVVGAGLKLTLLGVAIGTAAALALSGLLQGMLFEVTPFDPVSYLLTAALLLLVAFVACLIPARRALGVDPLVAIRQP